MNTTENAFHLLRVSPSSSRTEITEAREDASFDERASDDALRKAAGALTTPLPRLREEVSYLWGVITSEIDNLIKLAETEMDGKIFFGITENLSLSGLAKANLATHFCGRKDIGEIPNVITVLNLLVSAQGKISTKEIGELINQARKKSQVAPAATHEHITNALKKLRKEKYIQSAMNAVRFAPHPGKLATVLVEKWRFDKTDSGRFVVELIRGPYENWTIPILRPLEEAINRAVDVLYQSPRDEQSLRLIEQKLSEWDEYSQPIQLVEEGKGFDARRSLEVFHKLRHLCLHLHNSEGESEISLRIVKLLIKIFPELPEASELMSEDIKNLENILNQKHQDKKIKTLIDAVQNTRNNPKSFTVKGNGKPLIGALAKIFSSPDFAKDERLWLLILGLGIELHNEHQKITESYWLVKELFSLTEQYNAPQTVKQKIATNMEIMERNVKEKTNKNIINIVKLVFFLGLLFFLFGR